MEWELKQVDHVECTLDDSGIYTVINRVAEQKGLESTVTKIRVDIMTTTNNTPLISFIGAGDDVRKAVIKWVRNNWYRNRQVSTEHASYIGYEISRAMLDEHYIQD